MDYVGVWQGGMFLLGMFACGLLLISMSELAVKQDQESARSFFACLFLLPIAVMLWPVTIGLTILMGLGWAAKLALPGGDA